MELMLAGRVSDHLQKRGTVKPIIIERNEYYIHSNRSAIDLFFFLNNISKKEAFLTLFFSLNIIIIFSLSIDLQVQIKDTKE